MTTKADSSAEAIRKQAVPTVVCLYEDQAACAAVKGCCKFNRMFLDGGAAQVGPLQVLVAASEEALARRWPQLQGNDLRMIVLSDACFGDPVLDAAVFAYLPSETPIPHLERMIEKALHDLTHSSLCQELTERLRASSEEIDELNRIGVALSAEHRIPKLLEMILTKARQITAADAGSIYLVEPGPEAFLPRTAASRAATGHLLPTVTGSDSNAQPFRLRFAWTQNDTISLLPLEEMAVEISESSIVGHVALTGECVQLDDAYNPTPGLPFTINRSFDLKLGYHTKSILAVPMRNEKDEVVGVLQLMNCKREMAAKLTSYAAVSAQVLPFSAHHRELIMSLASQAAIALQNSRLLRSIETLFEGFVDASVIAIEERDPTTCGHSFRVAQLALALAEAVNRVSTGPLAEIRFTPSQMKELRYAALLHDFGKVGVRENVLLKEAKLYPAQLELLRQRFLFAKRTAEAESLRRQLEFLLANGVSAYNRSKAQQAEVGIMEYWERLDRLWKTIEQANLPTLNSQRVCSELAEAASLTFTGVDGVPSALVTEEETRLLSIAKGSLDPEERTQIEAHVIYTERFLSQIPWTGELHNVTAIAAGHHEKLNGTGYPHRLLAADIPVQTRIITVVDIFDALTATDRPYKKAVSPEGALDILRAEANAGAIDANLFELFVELIREGGHVGELQEQSSFTTDRSAVA
jgi:HD-GYP domain-containing protein (c-di-GMP phosphodiesterase class II)